MEVIELKFLLRLVGKDNYQGKLNELKPNSKTKVSETHSICRKLCDRELVACSEIITKIKIASAGKALLNLDAKLPIDADELKILRACATETITPGKTKVAPAEREKLIASLVERGLICAAEKKIDRVWLTQRGQEELALEYSDRSSATISLNLLNNYLCFLRKYFKSHSVSPITANGHHLQAEVSNQLSDREILQTIIDLDSELGTDNYLPIFHLRNKLQPSLSRKELDDALYRLQREDKLELNSLVEAVHYTNEQIKAGIPQDVGGSLFFLEVN